MTEKQIALFMKKLGREAAVFLLLFNITFMAVDIYTESTMRSAYALVVSVSINIIYTLTLIRKTLTFVIESEAKDGSDSTQG